MNSIQGDMMEIKEEICTLSERQNWIDLFLVLTKEELAELLLDRMVKDSSFSRELFYKLSKDISTVSEQISKYETAVIGEMNLKVADVDFLETISGKVMRRAAVEVSLLDKFRLYVTVIKSLDSALGFGAGWENEDDDVLLKLMDECRNLMLTIIEEKHKDILTMDFVQVYDLLKIESESYDPFDGDNRIVDVLRKIGN